MFSLYSNLNYIMQAFIACIFTWGVTILGSLLVFFSHKVSKFGMDVILSLSAGIMLSSTFFSLILPGLELVKNDILLFLISAFGAFIFGGLLMFFIDKFSDVIHFDKVKKVVISIMLHNIPEGLIIGVAFSGVNNGSISLAGAMILALGIGIQNFPEGFAVSFPIKREGISSFKAFLLGVLSAAVEPISAVVGALLLGNNAFILPFMIFLAAGCMIYVIMLEIIPEFQYSSRKSLLTFLAIIGFSVMMAFDVLLS